MGLHVTKEADPRSENRVVGSPRSSLACAWSYGSEPVELRQEIGSMGTTTVSGALYWLSKDPIGLSGGLNLYTFCANNPINFIDPDGLRVINSSGRTIPVVINETLPDGSQGPQEILYLPPGGDTDVLKPGWDTDGIYPPGDNTRVIKIVNGVIAEVLPTGGVRFPWYNNPIDTALQFLIGGWEDDAFLKKWNWPRPDPEKCK